MNKAPNYKSIAIDFELKNTALHSKLGSLEMQLKVATDALKKIKQMTEDENDEHENISFFVSEVLNKLNQ